jgi:hypothetical protein
MRTPTVFVIAALIAAPSLPTPANAQSGTSGGKVIVHDISIRAGTPVQGSGFFAVRNHGGAPAAGGLSSRKPTGAGRGGSTVGGSGFFEVKNEGGAPARPGFSSRKPTGAGKGSPGRSLGEGFFRNSL